MPFTDPMADGPAIQAAGLRALKAGQDTVKTLDLVARASAPATQDTPIDPDGLFQPDLRLRRRPLPRRRESGRRRRPDRRRPAAGGGRRALPAGAEGRASTFIRLATPTTDDKRLPAVLANTSGFVYYVSITGITGAATPISARSRTAVERIKRHTPPARRGRLRRQERRARRGDRARRRRRRGRLRARRRPEEHARRRGPRDGRSVAAVTTLVKDLSAGVRSVAQRRGLRQALAHAAGSGRDAARPDEGIGRENDDELDLRSRPPEDQDALQARDAGESLDQVPGHRADGLPQGSGGEPVGDPRLRTTTCACPRRSA